MRKLSFVLVVSFLLAMLAGCGGQPSPPNPSTGESPPTSTESESLPTPTDRQEVTEDGKSILYIGAFSYGNYDIEEAYSRLNSAVRLFSLRSDEYEARVVDYGDASAPEAFYRLNTDILTGQMPDMLLTHGMPTERYASLGLLYDMSDWLDPSDYFTGPLESMRLDGKLYEVSPGITVTGFYGLTSNLGSSDELSLDELYSIWERFSTDDDKEFIAGFTNELICLLLISSMESQFVDQSTATCSFDSPEFIKLLEFCNKLPDKAKELNLELDNPDFQGSPLAAQVMLPETHHALHMKEGEALLAMMASSRVWGIPYAPHALMTAILDGKEATFIGIPGANIASVYMEFPVAVSADSPNLDGTKVFIDQLWSLSFMSRGPGDFVMLPLKRSVLDSFVRDMINRTGEDRLMFFDEAFEPYTLIEFAEFLTFVDEARLPVRTPLASYIPPYSPSNLSPDARRQAPPTSSFVSPIIAEEVQKFFANAQDAAITAEHIQERYSTYLEEQKN